MHQPLCLTDIDADALANGFARRIERLAIHMGASADIARLTASAAAEVSRATAQGQRCVSLDRLADRMQQALPMLRETLLASGVVCNRQSRQNIVEEGFAEARLPLVLDAKDRLYLARYYDGK